MLALLAASHVHAGDAPRIGVDGSSATIEHPLGWTLMPASSSPMFYLCDPSMEDGCLVRGEMHIRPTLADMKVESLSLYLDAAIHSHSQPVPVPRRRQIGRFDAVESFWIHEQSDVGHGKAGVKLLMETTEGFFSCSLMAEPKVIEQQIASWRRFCASLDFVNSIAGERQHG